MLYINILIYDQISEIDVWGVSRIYRLLSVQGDIEEGRLLFAEKKVLFGPTLLTPVQYLRLD